MGEPNLAWSAWQDLADAVPTAPGVYQVRSCRPGGAGHTLPRLLAEDVEGTLIIGQSSNLERRRRAFQRRIRVGRGHSEANLLHRLRDAFRSHAKAGVLAQVEWRFGVVIPDHELMNLHSLAKIRQAIEQGTVLEGGA